MKYLTPLTGKVKDRPFATYDLETTTDLQRVYLLGFYDGADYRHFESEPMNPEAPGSPVDQFMRWLTSSAEHTNKWLYAHNAGNFDALYLMRWVWENSEEFTIEVVPLQSSILMLEVRSKRKRGGRVWKWTFLDSLRLMPASLEKLGKAFKLGGKVKGIDYETLHLDPKRYEYLETDCRLLYGVCEKFHRMIREMGGDVGVTAPSTAMASFRRNFMDRERRRGTVKDVLISQGHAHRFDNAIPTNRHFTDCDDTECPGCLHAFVRRGYYGGRVEVFRESWNGHRENCALSWAPISTAEPCTCSPDVLTLGDVNSMYPAAMLEPMPVELDSVSDGPDPQYREKVQRGLAGFVHCTVNVPAGCYLPPLPHRTDDKLIFPVGTFRGVWTTVELNNLTDVGGVIVDVERVAWFRCEPVLAAFVRHFYSYRDKSRADYDEAFDMVAKLLLNSLYGKFGMNENREKLWFFPTDEDFGEHRLTPIEDAIHGAFTEPVVSEQAYVIPHIAAWVTGIARSRLWRMMHDILQRGGRIWYCDTDSIVTDLDIPNSTALGELKQVCKIQRAHFAAPKLYFLKQADGPEYVKAKGFGGGFGAGKLTEADYRKVVEARGKLTSKKITKLREGMRAGSGRFPRMKTVTKGIHSVDEKRIHLEGGNTRPLEVNEP